MGDLELQKRTIELGKALVKELELDSGVDTLGRWMAHYVAEKIELAENLTGSRKRRAEKECFEVINELWSHRWIIPRDKPYLSDFEPLFKTLEDLNPSKKETYFFSPNIELDLKQELADTDSVEVSKSLEIVRKVDKIARLIILSSLNQFISGIELSGERGDRIKEALFGLNQPDLSIIKIVASYSRFEAEEGVVGIEMGDHEIESLKLEIKDLKEFISDANLLLKKKEFELKELTDRN